MKKKFGFGLLFIVLTISSIVTFAATNAFNRIPENSNEEKGLTAHIERVVEVQTSAISTNDSEIKTIDSKDVNVERSTKNPNEEQGIAAYTDGVFEVQTISVSVTESEIGTIDPKN